MDETAKIDKTLKSKSSNITRYQLGIIIPYYYFIGKSIGEGTFGKVRLGTHILTGERVAVKILEKDRITDVSDVERVAREIHILKIVRHPNIVQLYEIIETNTQLYLIMEYASNGELFDYIVSNTKVPEKEACRFFQQIISGIEYIHALRIVHRDLKPENLLLSDEKDVKIVDFGLSNTYQQDEKLKTACGSPCYAAPEMIAGKKYIGIQVDLWSAGVVLFALLCGYLPFEDQNTSVLYKKIMDGDYTIPDWISPDATNLIKGILNTDPDKRFTVAEIRASKWYKLVKFKQKQGILVGVHQIPIEQKVLDYTVELGFERSYIQKCVEANKHNSATTAYYLLLKKYIREGNKTAADLASDLYEPVAIGKKIQLIRDQKCNSNNDVTKIPHPPCNPGKLSEQSLNIRNRKYGKKVLNTSMNINNAIPKIENLNLTEPKIDLNLGLFSKKAQNVPKVINPPPIPVQKYLTILTSFRPVKFSSHIKKRILLKNNGIHSKVNETLVISNKDSRGKSLGPGIPFTPKQFYENGKLSGTRIAFFTKGTPKKKDRLFE